MSSKPNLLSSVQKQRLLNSLTSSSLAIRPCNEYERKGCPNKCKIGARSEKCVECVRTGRNCNLAPFSPTKWARLRRLREDKVKEVKVALAK